MASLEIPSEPIGCDASHFLQRARLRKQVRGARNDMQHMFSRQVGRSRPVPTQNGLIFFANNEKRGSDHVGKVFDHEVWTSPARHHRLDFQGPFRRRQQHRRGPRAGPEKTDPEIARHGRVTSPIHDRHQSPRQKRNIKT